MQVYHQELSRTPRTPRADYYKISYLENLKWERNIIEYSYFMRSTKGFVHFHKSLFIIFLQNSILFIIFFFLQKKN